MFKLLIKFVFWIITNVANIILTPIFAIFEAFVPDLTDIIQNVQLFLTNYVFNTLQWFKMFAINTLAFPLALLEFISNVFSLIIVAYAGMLMYKGILTIYQRLKP